MTRAICTTTRHRASCSDSNTTSDRTTASSGESSNAQAHDSHSFRRAAWHGSHRMRKPTGSPRHFLVAPGSGHHCRGFEVHRHRSEEHTSELQSQSNLVCRLLLEKKKIKKI